MQTYSWLSITGTSFRITYGKPRSEASILLHFCTVFRWTLNFLLACGFDTFLANSTTSSFCSTVNVRRLDFGVSLLWILRARVFIAQIRTLKKRFNVLENKSQHFYTRISDSTSTRILPPLKLPKFRAETNNGFYILQKWKGFFWNP